MVSVSIAPENKPGIENPNKVITGIKAFLRACLYITTFSLSPLALAVLM